MEFERLVKERYSVRNFKCEKLRKEDIDKIASEEETNLERTVYRVDPLEIGSEDSKKSEPINFNTSSKFIPKQDDEDIEEDVNENYNEEKDDNDIFDEDIPDSAKYIMNKKGFKENSPKQQKLRKKKQPDFSGMDNF